MFDLTDRKSFIDLKNWIEELKKVISTRLQKILLANKYDLVESG
jgi:GTPase SAR1 family protein